MWTQRQLRLRAGPLRLQRDLVDREISLMISLKREGSCTVRIEVLHAHAMDKKIQMKMS
jgi:hypothetical protein